MLNILHVNPFLSNNFCPDLSKILNFSPPMGNRQPEQNWALTFWIELGFMKLKGSGNLCLLWRNYTNSMLPRCRLKKCLSSWQSAFFSFTVPDKIIAISTLLNSRNISFLQEKVNLHTYSCAMGPTPTSLSCDFSSFVCPWQVFEQPSLLLSQPLYFFQFLL